MNFPSPTYLGFENCGMCVCNLVDDVIPPTGPSNMCFVDGGLKTSDTRIEGSRLDSVQVFSFMLEMCVNGSFGGICRRGFDNVDATAVCSSFGYGDSKCIAYLPGVGCVMFDATHCYYFYRR